MKKIKNLETFTDHLNNKMVDAYLAETSTPSPDNVKEGFTGEWRVEKNHIVDKETPGLIIASCNLFRSNWEANARLIAASPIFYKLAKHIEFMSNDAYLMGHPEWNKIAQEANAILNRINS